LDAAAAAATEDAEATAAAVTADDDEACILELLLGEDVDDDSFFSQACCCLESLRGLELLLEAVVDDDVVLLVVDVVVDVVRRCRLALTIRSYMFHVAKSYILVKSPSSTLPLVCSVPLASSPLVWWWEVGAGMGSSGVRTPLGSSSSLSTSSTFARRWKRGTLCDRDL